MSRLEFRPDTVIMVTSIVGSLLIREVKDYRSDYTDPEWIGLTIIAFRSISFFLILFSIFSCVLSVIAWRYHRATTRALIFPPLCLLFGLLAYFIELIFVLLSRYFQFSRLTVPSAANAGRYTAAAIPQYLFYFCAFFYLMIVGSVILMSSRVGRSRDEQFNPS